MCVCVRVTRCLYGMGSGVWQQVGQTRGWEKEEAMYTSEICGEKILLDAEAWHGGFFLFSSFCVQKCD